MIRLEEKRGRYAVAGTEVLSWRVSLPRGEDGSRLDTVYQEIGTKTERFCEDRLRCFAEEEFERCADPKKRFYFPAFQYRLETSMGEENGKRSINAQSEEYFEAELFPSEFLTTGFEPSKV